MYRFPEAEEMVPLEEEGGEGEASPEPLSPQRSDRFRNFLRQELRFCRTETEREVIVLALRSPREHMGGLDRRPPCTI